MNCFIKIRPCMSIYQIRRLCTIKIINYAKIHPYAQGECIKRRQCTNSMEIWTIKMKYFKNSVENMSWVELISYCNLIPASPPGLCRFTARSIWWVFSFLYNINLYAFAPLPVRPSRSEAGGRLIEGHL